MAKNHIALMRPRTVWDIADDTFDVFRERFVTLVTIAAVVYVPAYLVYIGWMATTWATFLDAASRPNSGDPFQTLAPFFGGFTVTLPIMGIAYTLQAAATAAAVDDHLHNREVTWRGAYRRAFSRFWPLLGAAVMVAVLATLTGVLTFFVLFLGAFVVITYYTFVAPILLIENKKFTEAVKRSRAFASRYFGATFGTLFLMGLMNAILSYGISNLISVLYIFIPDSAAGGQVAEQTQATITAAAVSSLFTVLLSPLLPTATTLLYYDIRVRREGMDMVAQAEEMEYPLAADPFGGTLDPKVPRPASR